MPTGRRKSDRSTRSSAGSLDNNNDAASLSACLYAMTPKEIQDQRIKQFVLEQRQASVQDEKALDENDIDDKLRASVEKDEAKISLIT